MKDESQNEVDGIRIGEKAEVGGRETKENQQRRMKLEELLKTPAGRAEVDRMLAGKVWTEKDRQRVAEEAERSRESSAKAASIPTPDYPSFSWPPFYTRQEKLIQDAKSKAEVFVEGLFHMLWHRHLVEFFYDKGIAICSICDATFAQIRRKDD
ncbi:MAG: hypothetical protein WC824_11995 [Bacteroidota bacterium]|jgi:hypothetical protein